MATIGRIEEVNRFLMSLENQTYKNFELIVVDQNQDNRLESILIKYKYKFNILWLKSEKGLSIARNVGLKYITGDIVAFPDDDCWYPSDLLEKVVAKFHSNPKLDGLTGRVIDENGHESCGNFLKRDVAVNKYNVFRTSISITIFLKKEVVIAVGDFNPMLGSGSVSIYQSGEETDYILRALNKNFFIYYYYDIVVHHKNPIKTSNSTISRAIYYGCGYGKLLMIYKYPLWFKLKALLRPFGGSILYLCSLRYKEAKYHWNVFKGRIKGMYG